MRSRKPGRTLSRRSFLSGAAAVTGVAFGTHAFAGRRPQANDMLDVAVIGVGGQGAANIARLLLTDAVNIVALCDCDERQAVRIVREAADCEALLRLAQAPRRGEDHRCRARRHTRSQSRHHLDCSDAARQTRLLREAARPQHLGSA